MHEEVNDWVFRRGPGFGPPFGRGPHMRKMFFRGAPGMGMGMGPQRRMRRGDVRFAVIDVLAEAPMHGYEMIRTLEERSGGRWRPSPGSVYPTLQLLADEGLVTAADVDGRRSTPLPTRAARRAMRAAPATARGNGQSMTTPILEQNSAKPHSVYTRPRCK